MAMLPEMLRRDRERWGVSVGEAGWRLGITRREYVAIEDGERPPNSTEYEAGLPPLQLTRELARPQAA